MTDHDLLARVQALEDIEAIKRLKYRYFRSIDTADLATLDTLITDDIGVNYKGGTYHWVVEGKDKVMQAIAGGFHNRALAQHTGHHPEIDLLSATTARGLWYLTDSFINLDTRLLTQGSSLYRDEYVKLGNDWKIRHSSYTRIYEIVETLERAPSVTYSLLAETGQAPTG
jgi:hypothetical protein